MRTLNRNERLLSIALGTVLFLLLNLVGMKWVSSQMSAARANIDSLQSDAGAEKALLSQRPFWDSRGKWMKAHPPEIFDERTSRSKFIDDIQAGIQAKKLHIDQQQPLETEHDDLLAITLIDLTLEGHLEDIVRWLYSIQQPGAYCLVRTFTLNQAEDGKTMQLQIRLGKVFRTGDMPATP